MENLTKQQIILLTLLVSFVTSIATGIITVSLMDQAPAAVTQTVNRIVERTIEKVVPQTTNTSSPTTVKETIIVNEGDQITKAIENNKNVTVRLYKKTGDIESFIGLGIWGSTDGKIIFPDELTVSDGESIIAVSSDGTKYNTTSVSSSTSNKIFVLKATSYVDSTSTLPTAFPSAKLSSTDPKLGQTIIVLSGEKKDTVMNGIVSSFESTVANVTSTASSTGSQTATTTDDYIQTSVDNSSLFTGSILMNLTGEVIGLRERSGSLFLPASLITREWSAIK
jgi:hypothetical protein